MIRQAISCDICGTDKQQTNHWFMAFDQGAELRISGFNAKDRFRSGAKHLCGQTCLHKLVDEFMARTIARRTPATEPEIQQVTKKLPLAATAPGVAFEPRRPSPSTDMSLTSAAAHTMPVHAKPIVRDFDGLEPSALNFPAAIDDKQCPAPDPSPVSNPRILHADAWKREREREQRAASNPRRRSIA